MLNTHHSLTMILQEAILIKEGGNISYFEGKRVSFIFKREEVIEDDRVALYRLATVLFHDSLVRL